MESFRVNRCQSLLQQVWYQTIANKLSYKPITNQSIINVSKGKLVPLN